MNKLLGVAIDYEKIHKFTSDAKYTDEDVKAAVAVTQLILTNAVKYNVESETLLHELQQLGLPKELATSVCKVHTDNYDQLREVLKSQSVRLSGLEGVEWHVHHVVGSSCWEDAFTSEVSVRIKLKESSDHVGGDIQFTASEYKFRVLLSEMKEVYRQMDQLSTS